MNTYFHYIDQVVLALCFVFTLVNTHRMVRRATVSLRRVPAYFAVFGATAIATFLGFGHLFEISYHAVERVVAGTFAFDFRFYSLLLMGMLLLTLSVQMLNAIGAWFQGTGQEWRKVIKVALLIVAVSAPAIVFSPIAAVPSIGCGITLLAMPFVMKRRATAPTGQTTLTTEPHAS